MRRYNPKEIEPKWQKIWAKSELYKTDMARAADKFYVIPMLPYTSGDIHIGHWYNFGPTDTVARFHRMLGQNVLQAIGFDAFGLPAENAAIKNKTQPAVWTRNNIKNMTGQLEKVGASYDWNHSLATCDSEYYHWNQWLFLQLYKHKLAYRAKGIVNWCPKDKTVLANEQVVGENNVCERCGTPIVQKQMEQWFFKITDYTQRLLDDLDRVDWPAKVKTMQMNWIGQSRGALVDFAIADKKNGEAISYVMGVDDIRTELESIGVKIDGKTESGSYKVSIPNKKIKDFEKLIIDKLKPGFWNEYISDKVVFIFKNKAGKTRKIIWNDNDEKELLSLCNKYANADFKSIQEMLEGNDWYAGKVTDSIRVFTTRPDTLFGATYMVLAPEHPLVEKLTTAEQKSAVRKYVQETSRKTELERKEDEKNKTGLFTGAYAINPGNKEKIPVWVADYVLPGYGTGAIMAVPAHDERDFEFAEKFNLPITLVIKTDELPYDGEGVMVNSGKYDEMSSARAREKMTAEFGKEQVNYRLRDWLISRQRYWGTPIPVVYCDKCGLQPLTEKDLPVILPEDAEFTPTGRNPLLDRPDFIDAKCPNCDGLAKRETDTMDTFVDSSWYFLRYLDNKNDKAIFDNKIVSQWAPVDHYIGGIEHAILHLLYARFVTKFLHDNYGLTFDEPFKKLTNQGIILGPDGYKMSKSRGNVVSPDEQVSSYGADSLRLYLMFMGPYDQGGPYNLGGIAGTRRFLDRIWTLTGEFIDAKPAAQADLEAVALKAATHRVIKKVTNDLESLDFNTAIAAMMGFVNELYQLKAKKIAQTPAWRETLENLTQLLAPFAPHLAEELWQELGHDTSVHLANWPLWDDDLVKEEMMTLAIQINGKVRAEILVEADISEENAIKTAKEDPKIVEQIEGKEVKKAIYVPGRLVSLVI